MQPVKPRTAKYFQLVPGRYPAAEDLADIKDRVIRNRLQMRIQKAENTNSIKKIGSRFFFQLSKKKKEIIKKPISRKEYKICYNYSK